MRFTPYQTAQIRFALDVGYLKASLEELWRQDKRRRSSGAYGPRHLPFDLFVETFLSDFRLAFILRDSRICYPYRELSEEDIDLFWNANRDLFTRYNGDSFEKEECIDIIAKRIREQEYKANVENILLQL